MTSQFQIINKILQTKDYSLISMNNLTEDHFFQYRAEFNFIKNHYIDTPSSSTIMFIS